MRWFNTLGPVLGLVGIYLFFVIIGPPSFSSARNLETIARQTAIVGTAALGMTLVIISGGIDLSVGSVVALATVIVAYLFYRISRIRRLLSGEAVSRRACCAE